MACNRTAFSTGSQSAIKSDHFSLFLARFGFPWLCCSYSNFGRFSMNKLLLVFPILEGARNTRVFSYVLLFSCFFFCLCSECKPTPERRGATENARCMCIATWLAGNVDRTGIIRENSSFTSEPNACSSLRYNNTSFFLEIQKHYSFFVEQTIRVLVYNRMHWFWSVLCYCYHRSTANAEFFIGWQKGGMAILLLSIMRVLTMRCCENISEFQHILIHWWNEHIFRS